jgi:hypothetical protein
MAEQLKCKELINLKSQFPELLVARTYDVLGAGGKNAQMTILVGGLNRENPKQYMDYVVATFVADTMYNEYIDANLDNPWLRIIIQDINDLI